MISHRGICAHGYEGERPWHWLMLNIHPRNKISCRGSGSGTSSDPPIKAFQGRVVFSDCVGDLVSCLSSYAFPVKSKVGFVTFHFPAAVIKFASIIKPS
jgi:hypothetical protein